MRGLHGTLVVASVSSPSPACRPPLPSRERTYGAPLVHKLMSRKSVQRFCDDHVHEIKDLNRVG